MKNKKYKTVEREHKSRTVNVVILSLYTLYRFDLWTGSTVWYFLFLTYVLVRRFGIFCFSFMNWFDGVVFFVFDLCTGSTVWYFLFLTYVLVRRFGIFCFSFMNWFDGVVFFVFHEKYQTVEPVHKSKAKNTTPSNQYISQKQKIPHRRTST
jgi:hypothetical protein